MEKIGSQFGRKVEIGQCIYCGNTDVPLTKEHIVPYCLGGSWVLYKASCEQCSEVTRRFEDYVNRDQTLVIRTMWNLPTRRRRARPTTLPLTIQRDGHEEIIDISIQDYPILLPLEKFLPPAYIDNRDYVSGICIIGMEYLLRNPTQTRDLLNIDGYAHKVTLQGITQAQLLAKIAYGFAVYKYGQSIIGNAPIRNSILAQTEDIGKWVGCINDTRNYFREICLIATSKIHEVWLGEDNNHNICANIKLFRTFERVQEFLVIIRPGN